MSVSVTKAVHFTSGRRGCRKLHIGVAQPVTEPARVPRISQLMALVIVFEGMLARGEVADYSALARMTGLDRGIISRLMKLRLLAPEIQEKLLTLDDSSKLTLKHLLPVCRILGWVDQCKVFSLLNG